MSQNRKILSHLRRKIGKWVSMPKLSRASGSLNIHSRISDLRNMGLPIENMTIGGPGNKKSFYRLS